MNIKSRTTIMADNILKYKSNKHKNIDSPNHKTYYSMCNRKRTNSSISKEINLTKYKNEMIRKIEDFINKENRANTENQIKIPPLQANKDKDIMGFREKRLTYSELYKNKGSCSKSTINQINGDNPGE